MAITVRNLQKKTPLNLRVIKQLIQTALDVLDASDAELSVVFVSHQKMRALNTRYHQLKNTTDVLSFDLRDTPGEEIQGEIIVSPDAARGFVRRHGGCLPEEMMLYVIHGILHLSGYDDHHPDDIRRMRQKERSVLQALGPRIRRILTTP